MVADPSTDAAERRSEHSSEGEMAVGLVGLGLRSRAAPFTRAVVGAMRRLYPESLADKSFDNTGLLLEAPFNPQRRKKNAVLLTIDLTKAVAEEAIQKDVSVVVAYHPIIFRGLKSLTMADTQQQSLLRLACEGISVYSPHTAVDAVPGGMADWLGDIVSGDVDLGQTPEASSISDDIIPEEGEQGKGEQPEQAEQGSISHSSSNRSMLSSSSIPTATGDDPFSYSPSNRTSTRPAIPKRTYSRPTYPLQRSTSSNSLNSASNNQGVSSTASPSSTITRKAITPSPESGYPKSAPAGTYTSTNTGAGRLLTFPEAVPLATLIERIALGLGTPAGFPVAIPQGKSIDSISIKTVGICPGSGGSVFRGCGADLWFTGELSHHEALAVTENGGCVVSMFHSNTERGYLAGVMADKLEKEVGEVWGKMREKVEDDDEVEAFADEGLEVHISEVDRDPFGIVILQDSTVVGETVS